jgi:pyruvate kinase
MLIRTKIIATVGPACLRPETLRRMIEAGVDLFRINFSHGVNEEHDAILMAIRRVEQDLGRPIGILGDLCGPKIRVGAMESGGAMLVEGRTLIIQREPVEGNAERISTTLAELIDQALPGQTILLDDGKLRLQVAEAGHADRLVCRVERGGLLSSGKGVNLPHTALTVSTLTEKDRADIAWIAARDFDYVAQSFVCSPRDIEELRALLADAGRPLPIIAKIEKPQAMAAIEAIVATADAIMVARGDLGVEMDLPSVPVAQKTIARHCALQAKPCIIATQMLESMTGHATPTRAEVPM